VSGTELGRLFFKNMGENTSKAQMTKHAVSSTRLIEIFSGRSKLVKGDTFAMDFVPGKGTTFYIAGQPQGAPVGDAEFFAMVLGIWVGDSPADPLLRDALLGD
jgi:Chalcone isomerase-like